MGRRVTRLMVAALTTSLAFGALAATGPSANADPRPAVRSAVRSADCLDVAVAAHRGSADRTHTENTLRSARSAAKRGADIVEGDMRLTRDGVWVMMHDDTVDRTTTGRGAVSSLTWAQVRRLTTNDGHAGGVPSVDALVTAVTRYPEVRLQLEIKPGRVSDASIRSLLRIFDAHGVRDRLLITSFGTAPLTQVRAIGGWKTAFVSTGAPSVATAQRLGVAVVTEQGSIDGPFVDRMHEAGIKVYAWTIDNQAAWQRQVNNGVDSIITNRVPDAMTWCAA